MVEPTTIQWLDGKQSTGQPYLRLAQTDNVAVALRTLKEGETVPYLQCLMKLMQKSLQSSIYKLES